MKQSNTAKQLLLTVVIISCAFVLQAQVTDSSNALLTPRATPSVTQFILKQNPRDSIIENRLVQLALAQPQYKQADAQNKILEYQLKKQRNNWLNLLSLSTTYNDQSFTEKRNTTTTAYVYPKYFLGVTIPVGLIISNSSDIKITKETQLITKGQQQELAKSIRASVISNFKQYRANEKLLAIQNQIVDDEQTNLVQAEQKFKEGTATLDVYNSASKKYNDELVKTIELQLKQDLIRVELERLIGMKLEDAIK